MSWEAVSAVMYHSLAKGTEKLVLLGIANHEGDGGAFPAHATLARYANVDERNVRRAITRLVESGELSVEVHGGIGRKDRKTNLYRVLVQCPVGCSGGYSHKVNEGAESPSREADKYVRYSDEGALAPTEPSNSYLVTSVLAVTPNGVTANTSLREEFSKIEEEEFMPWPVFDEGDAAPSKPRAADEETGVVGKIEDKRSARNEKYKRVKFDAVSPAALRAERPEDQWTTDDIVAEFYDLSRKAAPGIVSQVNGSQLAAWVNRQVGQGVPRIRVLLALRAFFDDPRNTRDAGTGQPLWRRFMAFFPSAQITVSESYNPDAERDLMKKMEAKALRDLGLG